MQCTSTGITGNLFLFLATVKLNKGEEDKGNDEGIREAFYTNTNNEICQLLYFPPAIARAEICSQSKREGLIFTKEQQYKFFIAGQVTITIGKIDWADIWGIGDIGDKA